MSRVFPTTGVTPPPTKGRADSLRFRYFVNVCDGRQTARTVVGNNFRRNRVRAAPVVAQAHSVVCVPIAGQVRAEIKNQPNGVFSISAANPK